MSGQKQLKSCLGKRDNVAHLSVKFERIDIYLIKEEVKIETVDPNPGTLFGSGSNEPRELKSLTPSEYHELGFKMLSDRMYDPFKKIGRYICYPMTNRYEIMVDSLQDETFFSETNARFRIYEILYHHLIQVDTDPCDEKYDPMRQWIIRTGLEYGFDTMIENYLKSLKSFHRIQVSVDKRCRACGKPFDPLILGIIRQIPVIQTIVPNESRGDTLLFKSQEIQRIRGSVDALYDSQSDPMCSNVTKNVTKNVVKLITECLINGSCPCVFLKRCMG
jgi:hypothetical protein